MSTTQIVLQFVGWGFLLYLSNRTLKRTEISRLKDQLVNKIDALLKDIKTEINETEALKDSLKLEKSYTAKLARIDLSLQQINSLSKSVLLDGSLLIPLWDLDIVQMIDNQDFSLLEEKQQDVIEGIENAYHSGLFKTNIFRTLYLKYTPELMGFFVPLLILHLIVQLFNAL